MTSTEPTATGSASGTGEATAALQDLVDILDLDRVEAGIFRGRSPQENLQRVFGGQVAGQALVAAGRTVPTGRPVHSLHAYFLRPATPRYPSSTWWTVSAMDARSPRGG